MGALFFECIARQDSGNGTRTLYGMSYGRLTNSHDSRRYFRLVKSNPSPKSADEISWTLVEAVETDALYYLQDSVLQMICSVDPSGSLTIVSFDSSRNIGVTRYDPSVILTSGTTIQSRWSKPSVSDEFSRTIEASTIFNVQQPSNQSILYHAAISGNRSEITFSYLNTTEEAMRTIPTRWNLSSTLQGARLQRLRYSSNILFAFATTDKTLNLLTMPAVFEAGSVPNTPEASMYSWTMTEGDNCIDAPLNLQTSSIDKSVYLFCNTSLKNRLLFVFNGTHARSPVLLDKDFPNQFWPIIAVDNTYLIMAEHSWGDVPRDVISSISLNDNTLGQYVRGTYFANVSDEYDMHSPIPDTDSDGSKMRMEKLPIVIGTTLSASLLLIFIVFVVYKRKERRRDARQLKEDERSRRSSTDSSLPQKQPARDEEDDIPWVDELSGKLVLVDSGNDNNDQNFRTQINLSDGSDDTIIQLSNFVTPSVAPSHSTDNQPSAPPLTTTPPTQPPVHRQVVVLSSHPRPRYFMSFEHEIEDNERDTQDPVQALETLATEDGACFQQHVEAKALNDSRGANTCIELTGPHSSEQSDERIRRQLIVSITDIPDVSIDPPPIYEG